MASCLFCIAFTHSLHIYWTLSCPDTMLMILMWNPYCVSGTLYIILQQPGKVGLLPFYRRKSPTLSVMMSKPGLPATPLTVPVFADSGAAGLWEVSAFNVWQLILLTWRYICNFSRDNIFLSVPLRQRWFQSLFMQSDVLCVWRRLLIRGQVLGVEGGQIKYRLPS